MTKELALDKAKMALVGLIRLEGDIWLSEKEFQIDTHMKFQKYFRDIYSALFPEDDI